MTRHVMRLPDLGEGTVSAEVIAWKVAPGDVIREDAPLVEMSTEKAVVEVPSPVSGRVVALGGKPGDDAIENGLAMDTFKRFFPPHPRGLATSDDDGATPHACA